MRKLLSANFARLKKDKFFWLGICFMAVMGAVMPITHYLDMQKTSYTVTLDDGFFSYVLYIAIVASVFCSLFIGTEYSDGTMRNKIIVGHRRPALYLSNLLTSFIAGLLLCAVCIVVNLCVGIPLLGFFDAELKVILSFVLCSVALLAAWTAMFTLIAMLCQNRAITAVVCILSMFLLLFVGTYIESRLSEPETYDGYVLYTESGEMSAEESMPNPNYIGGTKREVYTFLHDFLPGDQTVLLSGMNAVRLWQMSLYSLLILAVSTGLGLFFFRRKDLK